MDLIERSREIEAKVIKDGKRYFGSFFVESDVSVQHYISYAFSAGCNVNCYYCASTVRDHQEGLVPDINLKYNKLGNLRSGFYSPKELLEAFIKISENPDLFGNANAFGKVDKFAILDCETSIGMEYVFQLMDLIYGYNKENAKNYTFILFTNGILLGYNREYIRILEKYKEYLDIRFSIKAGSEEEFTQRLDVDGKYFYYPFNAIKECIKLGINHYVAVLCDERIMSKQEYDRVKTMLIDIGYNKPILEETLVMSVSCMTRIKMHYEKHSDQKFNFRFRKSFLLAYMEDDFNVTRRMRSGIRRIINNNPDICPFNYLKNVVSEYIAIGKRIETLVIVADLGVHELDEIIKEFDTNVYDTMDEIILLNSGKESENIYNELQISEKVDFKVKNYSELCKNEETHLTSVSSQAQVFAGNNITYYWT